MEEINTFPRNKTNTSRIATDENKAGFLRVRLNPYQADLQNPFPFNAIFI